MRLEQVEAVFNADEASQGMQDKLVFYLHENIKP